MKAKSPHESLRRAQDAFILSAISLPSVTYSASSAKKLKNVFCLVVQDSSDLPAAVVEWGWLHVPPSDDCSGRVRAPD
jgi:hypothetical protein